MISIMCIIAMRNGDSKNSYPLVANFAAIPLNATVPPPSLHKSYRCIQDNIATLKSGVVALSNHYGGVAEEAVEESNRRDL